MRWGWGPSAPAVAVVCAWMAASSSLILLNKAIYNDGFHFPLMATAIGRFFSASGGAALLALGCAPPCRPPTNRRLLSITPIVVLTVATLYAGNLAAITLSVSFMQIMKGLTPGVTLLVAAARGLEHLSMPLAVVVLLTAAGTGVGVLVEGCAPGFDRFAFGAMAASCAIEALRSVLVQELHAAQGGAFHPAEALVYIGMPAAVCLFALSLVFERPAVLTLGTGLVAAKPLLYLASFAAAFATNITGFWAIQVRPCVSWW